MRLQGTNAGVAHCWTARSPATLWKRREGLRGHRARPSEYLSGPGGCTVPGRSSYRDPEHGPFRGSNPPGVRPRKRVWLLRAVRLMRSGIDFDTTTSSLSAYVSRLSGGRAHPELLGSISSPGIPRLALGNQTTSAVLLSGEAGQLLFRLMSSSGLQDPDRAHQPVRSAPCTDRDAGKPWNGDGF